MSDEKVERSPEFEKAAEQLVQFLAKLHINDPVHKYVLADIYDMVNDARDKAIEQAKHYIAKLRMSEDFYINSDKRSYVLQLQSVIRRNQGVPYVENK